MRILKALGMSAAAIGSSVAAWNFGTDLAAAVTHRGSGGIVVFDGIMVSILVGVFALYVTRFPKNFPSAD